MNVIERTTYRRLLLLGMYSAVLVSGLWLGYELRFDFHVPVQYQLERQLSLVWLIPLQLMCLVGLRQLELVLKYFSLPDLWRILYALSLSACVALIVRHGIGMPYAPTRGVILADFLLCLVGLAGIRVLIRALWERSRTTSGLSANARRVAIIGAGDAGASLVRDLLANRGLGLQPLAFYDDNRQKWGLRIHGVPVLGRPERLLDRDIRKHWAEVIIAMPSAPTCRIGEIVRILRQAGLEFQTVPSTEQLATGQVKISQLREVEIEDLLGRESVELETGAIREILSERVVLVTGAGGSIGSELCRQIASFRPKQLILVERSETLLFRIEQELIAKGYRSVIQPLVADILDEPRMRRIFGDYRPAVLVHAAAHKHVPMMEHQPAEAIKNNTLGTSVLADMALESGAERFILISTDKAINPTSVMGASKRLAEIYLQALAATCAKRTRFMSVRFGNVLGSSGSVVPIFREQIASGGPVIVTHPEITRYFMTIPEAVGLVLQSAAQGEGGEIFVLDMGKPVRIVDLARQMIELSGLKPEEDIRIEFSGLRPGEKLFEEVAHKSENFSPTHHPKIRRLVCTPGNLVQARRMLKGLSGRLYEASPDEIKLKLKESVPEYQPCLTAGSPAGSGH